MHFNNLAVLAVLPFLVSSREELSERSSLRKLYLKENAMWKQLLTGHEFAGSMPTPPTKAPSIRAPTYGKPTRSPITKPTKGPATNMPNAAPVASPIQTPFSSPIAAPTPARPTTSNITLLDLIRSNPDLTTLNTAIIAAGPLIVSQIAKSSPETFFAPVNSAWNALGSYLSVLVSKPAYKLHLRYFVENHFTLNGSYLQSDLINGTQFSFASGELTSVLVNASSDKQIETLAASIGATTPVSITSASKSASNGVLYTIDKTSTPVWYYQNLCSLLKLQAQFTTLYSLVQATGLCDVLASSQTSTLLAPNNKAFAALPANILTYLTNPANVAQLKTVLLYHFLPNDLVNPLIYPIAQKITLNTAEGSDVIFRVSTGLNKQAVVSFNGVATVGTIILTKASIEYELPQVLVPPDFTVPGTSPVFAPIAAPVLAPVTSKSPLTSPVIAPVSTNPMFSRAPNTPTIVSNQPVLAPVTPVAAPVVSPVASPVAAPIASPTTKAPVAMPIASPTTKAPVAMPIAAPIASPISSPIASPVAAPTPAGNQSILALVAANPSLSNMNLAITTAGRDTMISTQGPSTLFAPTNAAFSTLTQGYLTALLTPEYILHLRGFIDNHFTAAGAYLTNALVNGLAFPMVSQETVKVINNATGVFLNTFASQFNLTAKAPVTDTGMTASNGVLHVVNEVLPPVWYFLNLIDLLKIQSSSHSTFLSLIEAAGLSTQISTELTSTLLAPNNAAFAALSNTTTAYLTNPANAAVLKQVLLYHLLPNMVNPLVYTENQNVVQTTTAGINIVVRVTRGSNNIAITSFNNVSAINQIFLTKWSNKFELPSVLIPPGITIP